MAASTPPKTSTFSLTSLLTLLGGVLIFVALPFPYFDLADDFEKAFQRSRAVAEAIMTDFGVGTDEEVVDAGARENWQKRIHAALDQRQLITGVTYKGNAEKITLAEPLRDIFWYFGYTINTDTTHNKEFASKALLTAERALESPSVWNMYRVAAFVAGNPSQFAPEAVNKAKFMAVVLGALPFLALACIGMPLMSRFHVMNPVFQAVGFAALVALAVTLATFGSGYTVDPTATAIGVPGEVPSIGMFCVLVAAIPLAVASIFGLSHKFWWLTLVLYVVVLLGAAVLWIGAGSGSTSAPAPSPMNPSAPADPSPRQNPNESQPINAE